MERVSDKTHGPGRGWVWGHLEAGVRTRGLQVVGGSDSGESQG